MAGGADVADRFLELHRGDAPLLLPNPWDRGSARLLASLGFPALAPTTSGLALPGAPPPERRFRPPARPPGRLRPSRGGARARSRRRQPPRPAGIGRPRELL